MSKNRVAVVDGNNVAYAEPTSNGSPRMSNLVAMRRALDDLGYKSLIIVDAALRHIIDDPNQLEALLDDKVIRQAPAQTDADYFVLELAEEMGGIVVSNDEFEEYRGQHPWISKRRVPFMIVNGHVELYEPQIKGGD
jgi:hypothetical protein